VSAGICVAGSSGVFVVKLCQQEPVKGCSVNKHSDPRVAEALLRLLRQTPDGKISASILCENLYKECASAKAVITQDYMGLKDFVASPALRDVVIYVPDQV